MSTYPATEILPATGSRHLSASWFVPASVSISVLGTLAIWPTLLRLWTLWTSDALKSIGMVVPIVSLGLIIRAWRRIGWRAEPSWWGFPLLLFAVAVSQIQTRAILLFVISPRWTTPLPPASLPLLAYGVGAVLLIGGTRLFRAALFPTLLLWFANPVPHVFTLLIDLPLQRLSALVARSFAMHLGQALTPDKLRLMFTPEFGMFIAPGCDGIRGAITMAFIALIAAYVYRFRWHNKVLVVVAALLLGYLFNLLRLCALVLYYLVALHFPSLQHKAENADYLIGAILFLSATVLLFTVIPRFRGEPDLPSSLPLPGAGGRRSVPLLVLAAVAIFGLLQVPAALAAIHPAADLTAQQFPNRVGNYNLVRTWNETFTTGAIAYHWAQYAPATGGTPIAIGVSPVLGWHDPLLCHFIRGEHPLWQGQLIFQTAGASPISFSSAFYNDGVTQHIEAATECTAGSCGEFATTRTHFGVIYSRVDSSSLLSAAGQHPIPVLLRAETLDMSVPASIAQQKLAADLKTFLASVDLQSIAHPHNR